MQRHPQHRHLCPITFRRTQGKPLPPCPRSCVRTGWALMHAGGSPHGIISCEQRTSTWFFEHESATWPSFNQKHFLFFLEHLYCFHQFSQYPKLQGRLSSHKDQQSQWQHFHWIWPTGSLCWEWKSLLLTRCCSATIANPYTRGTLDRLEE